MPTETPPVATDGRGRFVHVDNQGVRVLLALALALASACAGPGDGTAPPLTVFAAASLKTALDEIDARVVGPTGHRLRLTYAGTPALARQIEAGAPADVFIAADDQWMDYLQAAGRIDGASRVTLVGNSLVLIAPATERGDVPLDVAGLDRALGPGRLAVADPDTVPAGRYARQALEHLGLWHAVRGRLAPHENVRAALALVARGEAPLGIVYASDAVDERRVAVVARLPADSHAPVRYPAAVVAGASSRAPEVLRLLASEPAQAIFMRHGFSVPPGGAR